MEQALDNLGIVVIGRNEGERLRACLRSLPPACPIVYVDSGSTDGSTALASSEGAAVVELSADAPFSAARGRNAGFEYLRKHYPHLSFVQFVDGDCVVLDGWLEQAIEHLLQHPGIAAAAGQRMERKPDASWYNELCAIEWNTPIGRADAVGGDAVYRVSAFSEAGGFDPSMMAGEEPELCLRLRKKGYKIERLDLPMTLHDADIHSFGAWWKRAERSGFAFTLGAAKHGREGYNVREVVRAFLWGAGLPLLAVGSLLVGWWPVTLFVTALYVFKWLRLARRHRAVTGRPYRYAAFLMLTNVAEVRGIVTAIVQLFSGQMKILEYKTNQTKKTSRA
jgi:GT2 family glycosyltransferase